MKNLLLLGGLLCLLLAPMTPAQRPPVPDVDGWVYRGNDRWDPSWNSRPAPKRGACFFSSSNFSGNRFCVRSGDRLPSLPGNWGDNISSIQNYGSRITVFNDRNFSGGSRIFAGSIRDLRNRSFRDGHTWNNRISSLIVR